MSTLHDRLVDLAEASLDGRPVTGADLWDRGIAVRRHRRIGTVAVLTTAAVLLVLLGAVTWARLPHGDSLPAGAPPGIPDHLYAPSPWLPGTKDAGPLGRIAAVLDAPRSSFLHDRAHQPVGVSATTGAYRFLDLPDLAGASLVARAYALAPDGGHLAYWTQGRVAGTSEREVTGVAVYDPITGRVRHHALPGPYGVSPVSLVWSGDTTLAIGAYTNLDDSGTSRATPPLVWDLSAAEPHTAPSAMTDAHFLAGGPGFVVTYGKHLTTVDLATGRTIQSFPQLRGGFQNDPGPDPTGRRVALVAGGSPPPSVTVLSAGGRASVVPDSAGASAVLGWAGAGHVAVLGYQDPPDSAPQSVALLDVTTGQHRTVTTVDDAVGLPLQLATEMLAGPSVPAEEPPHPLSPRLVAGSCASVLACAVLGLLIGRRRRVRP